MAQMATAPNTSPPRVFGWRMLRQKQHRKHTTLDLQRGAGRQVWFQAMPFVI
jgi:hypothetical protein